MSTINPNRIARAQQRRGLGEPSRLEASPLRHFDWLLVGRVAGDHRASGLLMIYSTHAPAHPRRPVLLREAPGAVRGRIGIVAMVVRAAHRLQAPARLSMVFYGVTVFLLAGGARADRLEHQGPPGVVPAARRVHAAAVGAGEVRPHRVPRRLLQPLPRRDRRVAPHRDHRPRERARSVWCCCSPTSGR